VELDVAWTCFVCELTIVSRVLIVQGMLIMCPLFDDVTALQNHKLTTGCVGRIRKTPLQCICSFMRRRTSVCNTCLHDEAWRTKLCSPCDASMLFIICRHAAV
jgi:hypothetical protein